MDTEPEPDMLFTFALSTTGGIYVNCPPERRAALPGVMRIIADALDAGETYVDVLDVPVEELRKWRRR